MRPAEVRVWDPFVRVFHWSLLALFISAWLTGDELDSLHVAGGYAIAGLVTLRIVWGFAGRGHARFASFVRGPRRVALYLVDTLRGRAKRHLGHNPAGGAMIVALLLALAGTTGSGIAMEAGWFGDADWLEGVHEALANLTLVLAGVHVAGVVFASLQHRENLVRAMFTGRKRRAP
ncbi:MAG: cytochrome b/b6 domain-containing protein [Rhodospirillaceae bacterium]|nr:cytochrome b/b6 domain-containing protein [Rhodospirillaceae bacterium]